MNTLEKYIDVGDVAAVKEKTIRGSQNGSAIVECAIVFPVLSLILFGIIQWGSILSSQITLRNAAASAARVGIVNGNGSAEMQAEATRAISPNLNASYLTTNNATKTTVGGVTTVTVNLEYTLPLMIPYVVPGRTGNNFIIRAVTTMR